MHYCRCHAESSSCENIEDGKIKAYYEGSVAPKIFELECRMDDEHIKNAVVYSCDDNNLKEDWKICTEQNMICISGEGCTSTICEDSDGGMVLDTKGEIYIEAIKKDGTKVFINRFSDGCTISDKKKLVEFFCKDGVGGQITMECPTQCNEGACI